MCILYIKCFVFEYTAKFVVQLLCAVVLTRHAQNGSLRGKLDYDNTDLNPPGHKVCVTYFHV